ncbi:MAG: aspartate aminotransferase family protein [Candidatus Delongbacteria bacterium]|nr:aspartate aminotransferase family protein [Candidatus Delongbacteria bacterium]
MPDITITELTQTYIMNTYKRFPLELSYGRGACLYDTKGREYLDFLGGIAVNALGYSHPVIVQAIEKLASGLIHTSNLFYTRNQALLAQWLVEHSGFDKAFFCNSGTEANEGAIKLARKWGGGRYRIITAFNSFHGRTLAALTATGQTKYQQGFEPLVPGFDYVPFNNLEAIEKAVTSETVAVMLEAIQAEGGVLIPDPEYLKGVESLCRRHQLLLIIDEVQTGIGRCGTLFAFQAFGVEPDIITLAKALGGGLPIGCMLARQSVAAAFEPGHHASTFGGGELVTGVALAVLQTLWNDGIIDQAAQLGLYALKQLQSLADRFPHVVTQVRGRGLLIGVEINPAYNSSELGAELLKSGLITAAAGGNVIRMAPPLIVNSNQIDRMVQIMETLFSNLGS